jgi:site-specific DNA-methyltransferase (adenine-specific)
MIAWVYSCLSEDTQIVTPDGIVDYRQIKPNNLVLCYDILNKEYSYQPVEEVYEYTIKDTAYRIQSDSTDQIVSRNHRCIVERDGREVFIRAEDLKEKEYLPILESVYSLQCHLSNTHKGASNKKEILLQRMLVNTNKKETKTSTSSFTKRGMEYLSSLWGCIFQEYKTLTACTNSSLFKAMQWETQSKGTCWKRTQRSSKLDRGVQNQLKYKDDWRNQSKLERWHNLSKEKGTLQTSKICKMSTSKYIYGTSRWIYSRASLSCGSTFGEIAITNRSSTSHKWEYTRQQIGKPNVIPIKQRPQTIRKWQGHKATLANITPINYEGKIWCVKVPTGSFVAVRNGMAFVTGNSGFPKSHNVSCAIDKSFGHPNRGRAIPTASTYQASDVDKENKLTSNEVTPYEPLTDEAKNWQGWGTALKPASEPITMARKPLEGTVTNNVLKWGVGAINIDATRVPMDEDDFNKLSAGVDKIRERGGVMDNSWKNSSDLSGANPANPLGRWGANFIHDGSQEVLDLFPDAKGGAWVQTEGARHFNNNGKPTSPKRLASDTSSGSAARFFYCSKSNKRDRNEGLEDLEPKQYSHDGREVRNETAYQRNDSVAANHHPTVKPTDLMRYLVRMVTRRGGTVLDPFMGSGTTGKAAMLEGVNFIGCELDEEYLKIAEKRIQHEINKQV